MKNNMFSLIPAKKFALYDIRTSVWTLVTFDVLGKS